MEQSVEQALYEYLGAQVEEERFRKFGPAPGPRNQDVTFWRQTRVRVLFSTEELCLLITERDYRKVYQGILRHGAIVQPMEDDQVGANKKIIKCVWALSGDNENEPQFPNARVEFTFEDRERLSRETSLWVVEPLVKEKVGREDWEEGPLIVFQSSDPSDELFLLPESEAANFSENSPWNIIYHFCPTRRAVKLKDGIEPGARVELFHAYCWELLGTSPWLIYFD
ncbi:hypothetical protein NMY22_g13169 [Coprinellus aureogranulatus]|nr:hypothetical protein NMY22_g13169 [Coprinellus aureogranulatus]